MHGSWMSSLGVALGLLACRAAADEMPWRAAPRSGAPVVTAGAEQPLAVNLGRPVPFEPEPATASRAVRPFTLVSQAPAPASVPSYGGPAVFNL